MDEYVCAHWNIYIFLRRTQQKTLKTTSKYTDIHTKLIVWKSTRAKCFVCRAEIESRKYTAASIVVCGLRFEATMNQSKLRNVCSHVIMYVHNKYTSLSPFQSVCAASVKCWKKRSEAHENRLKNSAGKIHSREMHKCSEGNQWLL